MLTTKISLLPDRPGVYILKNKANEIIYIGKAVSLKKRVKSHFLNKDDSIKQSYLVRSIFDIDYIITENEVEALLLESNLIKKYSPKFNVRFKDDKRYPYITLTINEKYPKLILTRRPGADNLSFGPFLSAHFARQIINLAVKLFKIHKCRNPELNKKRVCLNYDIGLCSAPCQNYITVEEYKITIEKLKKFLKGDISEILKELTGKMNNASKEMQFEKAAEYRDLITALNNLSIKQFAEKSQDFNYDVICIKELSANFAVVKLIVRDGKVFGKEDYYYQNENNIEAGEVIEEFIKKEYSLNDYIPKEIIVNIDFENREIYENWFKERTGYKVEIIVNSKGMKYNTLKLAEKNAENLLRVEEQKFIDKNKLIYDLKEILKLKRFPYLIEAFDISNFSGKETVASMVVFVNGRMDKKRYRRFRIRTVQGIDDFASMSEVIYRRYKRVIDEKLKFPDLIIVDGGKGQITSALKSLNELSISEKDIDIIGLAKQEEIIYKPTEMNPIKLDRKSIILKFIQIIRDEAHRFAITYHKKLREEKLTFSILDKIKGIGKKRKELILKNFGSVYQLKYADIEKLSSIKGINRTLAAKIKESLGS